MVSATVLVVCVLVVVVGYFARLEFRSRMLARELKLAPSEVPFPGRATPEFIERHQPKVTSAYLDMCREAERRIAKLGLLDPQAVQYDEYESHSQWAGLAKQRADSFARLARSYGFDLPDFSPELQAA